MNIAFIVLDPVADIMRLTIMMALKLGMCLRPFSLRINGGILSQEQHLPQWQRITECFHQLPTSSSSLFKLTAQRLKRRLPKSTTMLPF